MGIYLPNLEIPEYCGMCPVMDGETAECSIPGIDRSCNPYDGRYKNCIMLNTPPHGDLIDRGKLIKRLERQIEAHEKQARIADEKGIGYTKDMYIIDRNRDLISMLKALSAVIPAEEE